MVCDFLKVNCFYLFLSHKTLITSFEDNAHLSQDGNGLASTQRSKSLTDGFRIKCQSRREQRGGDRKAQDVMGSFFSALLWRGLVALLATWGGALIAPHQGATEDQRNFPAVGTWVQSILNVPHRQAGGDLALLNLPPMAEVGSCVRMCHSVLVYIICSTERMDTELNLALCFKIENRH